MKKALTLLLSFAFFVTFGQDLTLYQTKMLNFQSRHLQDSLLLDVTLPRSFPSTSERVGYPLVILFDSYNENTHRYNLQSIDILTYHSQMPESVVVGIPFNENNRRYLTSRSVREGDTLTGIDRMERFLFEELIPFLKTEYRANGPILLLGHSRTGFLTSYLMVKRSQDFALAGSFSAFWDEGFQKSDLEACIDRIQQGERPFHYYFSAGSLSREEETYYQDLLAVQATLTAHTDLRRLRWQFLEHPYAGHMMNYNLSVPRVLNDYFGKYSSLLTNWVFEKAGLDYPAGMLAELKKDFAELSNYYGFPFHPEPVHYISIGNAYLNREDYHSAVELFGYGLEFYPGDYELIYHQVLSLNGAGRREDARTWIGRALDRIRADAGLSEAEKTEYVQTFDELRED